MFKWQKFTISIAIDFELIDRTQLREAIKTIKKYKTDFELIEASNNNPKDLMLEKLSVASMI